MSEIELNDQAEQPPEDHGASLDDANTCNILKPDIMKNLMSKKAYTFMVSGLPRAGKSTLLNNLFGLKLETKTSAKSVTIEVVVQPTPSRGGIRAQVVDTPGLQAHDKDTEQSLRDMRKTFESEVENFTLVYCMAVINSVDVKIHIEILKSLTDQFGADIWKTCVLVLTYCDTLRCNPNYSKDHNENYKKCLREFAETFKSALHKCYPDAPDVKMIFDCTVGESSNKGKMTVVEVPSKTIVAVPAAITKEEGRQHIILPGFNIDDDSGWTEYALCEIIARSGKFKPEEVKMTSGGGGLLSYLWSKNSK